jgi:plasmid maintenance system antidote protein VapI
LKSISGREAVTFGVLQTRLIRFVNSRISNGDFTERGLARVLQISQPQIHNVLKGIRKLTPELADHVLQCFGMTALDLVDVCDLNLHLFQREKMASLRELQSPVVAEHIGIQHLPVTRSFPRKRPKSVQAPSQPGLTGTA